LNLCAEDNRIVKFTAALNRVNVGSPMNRKSVGQKEPEVTKVRLICDGSK